MKPEFITGPGDYDYSQACIRKQAPRWTMMKKFSMRNKSCNPPVGLYEVDQSYNKTQRSSQKVTLKSR